MLRSRLRGKGHQDEKHSPWKRRLVRSISQMTTERRQSFPGRDHWVASISMGRQEGS
jgi:hypothetical protein